MKQFTNKSIYFLGIGGAGMSPLARLFLQMGLSVSGSDIKKTTTTIRLEDEGAKIFYGHDEAHLRKADVVVYSSAIDPENVEYKFALKERIQMYKRAEMMNFLFQMHQNRIAVTGTHGKTTTTAMISRIMKTSEQDVTYLIGSDFKDFGGNHVLGDYSTCILEADESDGSFLMLDTNLGVITNLESEHMEYYGTLDNLKQHFLDFIDTICQKSGHVFVNGDDEMIMALLEKTPKEFYTTFGKRETNDIFFKNVEFSTNGTSYDLYIDQKFISNVSLKVYGVHNIYNSLASISVANHLNVSYENQLTALQTFVGTRRRFELIGDQNGVTVYDDYGHHPTEIKATLNMIKDTFKQRVICIFQPHRFSRTRDLLHEFVESFDAADVLVLTDIYSASEENVDGINSKLIYDQLKLKSNLDVFYIAQKGEIALKMVDSFKENDIVVTMGAGDIHRVSKDILLRLKINNENTQKVDISKLTSFKQHGVLDTLIEINTVDELVDFIKTNGHKFHILGNGSNSLVDGVNLSWPVIKLKLAETPTFDETFVRIPSYFLISEALRFMKQHELGGLEFAAGVPASIGGMVVMNFGCWDQTIGENVNRVHVVDMAGNLRWLTKSELLFNYRSSIFHEQKFVVLSIEFKYEKRSKSDMTDLIQYYVKERKEKQPIHDYTFGSVFKNHETYKAAQYLEESNLRGYTVGGVAISEKHSNFMVNLDKGTYEDALSLITHAKQIVHQKYQVDLQLEVCLIND